MNGFSVRQQNNPKIPVFHLGNLNPAPKSAVSLLKDGWLAYMSVTVA
jgi:hypothetical protein